MMATEQDDIWTRFKYNATEQKCACMLLSAENNHREEIKNLLRHHKHQTENLDNVMLLKLYT